MIALLRGEIVPSPGDFLIVMVGGVGYRVFVSDSTRRELPQGGDVTLHVYTHVREDALLLFGFATPFEQQLFETLMGVSGVGPRLALAILSHLSPERVVSLVVASDVKALTKVPGVGKKTAERLILELKDRLARWLPAAETASLDAAPATDAAGGDEASDVRAALVGLGYTNEEAESIVAHALAAVPNATTEELLKAALRQVRS